MLVLIAISLYILYSYTIAVCIKNKKIPRSISATFYAIEHKWWFRFTMWVSPMLLIPPILEISVPNTEFLSFLSLLGMIAVGCAPDFQNDPFQRKMHIAGAVMLLAGSQTWLAFNCWQGLLVWIIYLLYTITAILLQKNKSFVQKLYNTNPMFWIEICCTNIYVTLFTKYLVSWKWI